MYCCHLEGCLVFYLFIFLFISLGDFGWVKIKTTLFPIRLCNIVIFLLPPPSLLTCQFLIISLYTLLATTDHPPLVYPRKPGEIDAVTNILQGEFLSSPRAPPPLPNSLGVDWSPFCCPWKPGEIEALEKIFSDVLEDILELSRNHHRCARNLSRRLSVQTNFWTLLFRD